MIKNCFFSILGIICCLAFAFSIKSCGSPASSSKVYRIARDLTWYPGRAMGKQNNLLAFTDDLIFHVASEEKLRIELISNLTNNLFVGLDNGNFDAIVSSMLPTPISREDYVFSDPFFLIGPVLVVAKGNAVSTLSDMENKIIGIQNGSSMVYDIDKYPHISITPYDNILLALESLSRGHIDGVILDVIPAHIYISSLYSDKLKIATLPLTKEGLRMVSRLDREGEKFITLFNDGLKKAKESGAYDALLKKWTLFNPEKTEDSIPGLQLSR